VKTRNITFGVVFLSTILCFSSIKEALCDYWPTGGWRSIAPDKADMDEKKLEEIDAFVADNLPKVTSALLVRHGYVVFERYYSGDASTVRPMYNETTSVVSSLIGIAVKQGFIKSADQRMMDFFSDKA
jgi:hypothetical protein